MNHTTNYNLNQWEDGDRVTREDFNADNAKIDAAIKAVSDASPEIVFGTYVGNSNTYQEIMLGRQPRVVYVVNESGLVNNASNLCGGLATRSFTPHFCGYPVLEVSANGFLVYSNYGGSDSSINLNKGNATFCYVAVL